MANTRTKPYLLADYGAIDDLTVFVDAAEYANTQDELPLDLDWGTVYHKLATPTRKELWFREIGALVGSREMVKLGKSGWFLNGIGTIHFEPDAKVITGPSLSDYPKFGGTLDAEETRVLHQLASMQFHKANKNELVPYPGAGHIKFTIAMRALGKTLARLDQLKLVSPAAEIVYLENFGFLRTLQDNLDLPAD